MWRITSVWLDELSSCRISSLVAVILNFFMVHKKTNILFLPSQVVERKMQKFFLAETPHQFILTITTVHEITNTGENCMCRICKTSAESDGIIRNADACMYKCSSVPKQKRTIMQNW